MRKVIWAIIFAVFLNSAPGPLLSAPRSHARVKRYKPAKVKLGKAGKIKVKKYKATKYKKHRRH